MLMYKLKVVPESKRYSDCIFVVRNISTSSFFSKTIQTVQNTLSMTRPLF